MEIVMDVLQAPASCKKTLLLRDFSSSRGPVEYKVLHAFLKWARESLSWGAVTLCPFPPFPLPPSWSMALSSLRRLPSSPKSSFSVPLPHSLQRDGIDLLTRWDLEPSLRRNLETLPIPVPGFPHLLCPAPPPTVPFHTLASLSQATSPHLLRISLQSPLRDHLLLEACQDSTTTLAGGTRPPSPTTRIMFVSCAPMICTPGLSSSLDSLILFPTQHLI